MYRIGNEEIEAVGNVIKAKSLFRYGDSAAGHRQEVAGFEREWAEKIGTRYALCLSGGGTAALICGLVGLGIGPGDEVIVPGYTFMATATAVLAVGAIPVIAEIDGTMAMDPEDAARKIGPAVKAIIPVHMVGIPAHMKRITDLAKQHGIKVLEDCCQADGGSFGGRRLGSWGDAGGYSFNDFKIMSAGEGGALVTGDRLVYERAMIHSDSGLAFRAAAAELAAPMFLGRQYRASEVMGAILRVQLRRLDGMLADLRRIKKTFKMELAGNPGITFAPSNDEEGDCGVVVAFQMAGEEQARTFAGSGGVAGWLPINSGKHVYSNWDLILEKRVGHHPALNPFHLPQNKALRTEYRPDMCPATLDILKRTIFVSLHPDMTEQEVDSRITACRKAGKGL